jgi:hypothetical protein
MDDPGRDEAEVEAADAGDLELELDEADAVKGGTTTSGGKPVPPPLVPGG